MKNRVLFIIFLGLTAVTALQAQQVGNALSFSANRSDNTQYIDIPNTANPTAFTLELWVKTTGGINQTIIYHSNSGNLGYDSQELMIDENARFRFYIFDLCGNTGRYITGTTVTATDTWYHVSIVASNGGFMRLYVNGVEEGTPIGIGTMYTNLNEWHIGNNANTQHYFTGELDEIRLWDVVRSQSEIQASYGSLTGSESNLIGYWKIDEGSGSSINDATSYGCTGTLTGSPTWVTSAASIGTPVFSASPSSYDFGNVLVSEFAQTTINISNTGSGILNLSSATVPGSFYSVSPTEANLLAGEDQDFTVTFAPISAETQNGNLAFTDNVGNSTVPLYASGVFTAQDDAEYCLSFNGGDYISIPYKADLNPANFTVEFWAKVATGSSGNRCPVSARYWDGSNGYYGYNFYYNTNDEWQIVQGTGNPGGWASITYAVDAYDKWMHIAGVYDGTTLKLYVDGKLADSLFVATYGRIAIPLYIGCITEGGCNFNGEIDEVRIWNVARSQNQIQTSYGSQSGDEEGLVGYWRMDKGSGSSIYDGTGNGNTGTLQLTPTWVSSSAPVTTPAYQTSGSSLPFSNVDVNATSDQTVTITNNGGGVLNISTVISNNERFTVSPSSANLAAGANQVFTVTFAPTTHGVQNGTLTLTHNPNGTTHTILLSGTGQQAVFSASDSIMAFGNAQINAGSEQTITVTNNGNISLSITNIVCDPTLYTISPTTATIFAGDNQVFTVTLTPTSTGSVPGTITFTYNALNSPQEITTTGTGVVLYGSGTSEAPYQIANLNDLKIISEHSSYWADNIYFIQTVDIDASATSGWNSGDGFSPIGSFSTRFSGNYDGQRHIVDNLKAHRTTWGYNIGLFGFINGATIQNLGVKDICIGAVQTAGGLVGYAESSNIIDCYSSGSLSTISNYTGGLIGAASGSNISGCYSSCSIDGHVESGGLIGVTHGCTISNCYSCGNVTGTGYDGGLVGRSNSCSINNCFSIANVQSSGFFGGLIGDNETNNISNCFWDIESSGITISDGGTGKTTAEMKYRPTFTDASWDFKNAGTENIWSIGNDRNSGYPYLNWQYPSDPVVNVPTLSTNNISDISKTTAFSGGNITADGGESILERGICWSTSTSPTTSDSHTSDGSGTGVYTSNLTGLSPNTPYYVRAFAKNLAGIAYGDQKEFTTSDAPIFSASPSSHDFGNLLIGVSVQQTITITNSGIGYLHITTVTVPGDAYSVSPTSADIPSSSSQVFTLTFTPISASAQNGNLAFMDNNGNHNIAITGSGLFQAQPRAEKALSFNANDCQYVEIPDIFQPTAYTMEMWVKPSGGTTQNIFMRTSSAQPQSMSSQQLYINSSGKFCHYIWDGSPHTVTSTTTAEAYIWYHITIVAINNGHMRLYINGLEEGTAVTIGTMAGDMDQYRIGASCTNNTIGYFNGTLDEVRLFNHARTRTMVQADYASFAGNESNLIGYWRFDEGSDTTTGDGSGNSKTGSLVNSPTWVNSDALVGAPIYRTNSSNLVFGNVAVNTTSDKSVTITNNGGGILHISSVASDNDRFSVTPTSANIYSGSNQEFTVTFAPTTHGTQNGNLTFTHNPVGATNTISLSGSGLVAQGIQTSNIQTTITNAHETSISWTNGGGDYRAAFVCQGIKNMPGPTNNVVYSANSTFGSGSQIGSSGWYCVYNGAGNSVVVTNMNSPQDYTIAVFEYDVNGENKYYLTSNSSGNPRVRIRTVLCSGNALIFDGSDDYVSIQTNLAAAIAEGTAITIEYWFKGSQLQSPVRIQNVDSFIVPGWGTVNPTHIISTDGNTSGGISVGDESIIEDGNWHHLAMTWQKNTSNGFSSYLDGKLVTSRNSADANLPAYSNITSYLGCYNASSEYLTGQLDEVRIWNVARTASQIQEAMCKSLDQSTELNLLLYYSFDHGSGNSILADKKNSWNGQLNNMDVDNAWVKSGVPLGSSCIYLNTTIPTAIGCSGQCCNVTIISTPNASNFLDLYTSSTGLGPVTIADVGIWPEGIVKRADIIWGVHAVGTVTANLVFDYSQMEGVNDPSLIHLIKRSDASSEWIDVTSEFVHNTTTKLFSRTGNSSFSEFSISTTDGDTPLPVELSEFNAVSASNSVNLTWRTESESENIAYRLYRDSTMIAETDGAGTTTEPHDYAYQDNYVIPGKTYTYILADVTIGNKEVWHTDESVSITIGEGNLGEGFNIGDAYPNPFNSLTVLPLNMATDADVQAVLYDLKGRMVRKLYHDTLSAGTYDLKIDCSMLTTGIYFVQIRINNAVRMQKIMLMK